jgi:hypothetical protein
MKRTATRVALISTDLERRRKGPIHRAVAMVGETARGSGLPPFDAETGAKA